MSMASNIISRVWLSLELWERIAVFVASNDLACTLRLVNKSMAEIFKGFTTVRLSQPVPHHAFVHRWGNEDAMDHLARERRRQLLILTARSGSLSNLQVAFSIASCSLTEDIFNAAAASGHLDICVWLHDKGCKWDSEEVLRAAARAGHAAVFLWCLNVRGSNPETLETALNAAARGGQRALCEELLAAGATERFAAACEAAEGGHVELTEWLLRGVEGRVYEDDLLAAAAYGFDLAELQRLFECRKRGKSTYAVYGSGDDWQVQLKALRSPTPDWRAKFEWLKDDCFSSPDPELESEFDFDEDEWDSICEHEDARERIEVLMAAGSVSINYLSSAAIRSGSSRLLRYLREKDYLYNPDNELVMLAAERGDLAALEVLLSAGFGVTHEEIHTAVRGGHLHVLQWLLAEPDAGPEAKAALEAALEEGEDLASLAASSGNLELVAWLRNFGFICGGSTFVAAVEAGDVPLMEQLVAWVCPTGIPGREHDLYLAAGRNGDLATLRCLRRLGCPWDPNGGTVPAAIREGCSLEVLQWLVAEGCPVDWVEAWRGIQVLDVSNDVKTWVEAKIPPALLQETQAAGTGEMATGAARQGK